MSRTMKIDFSDVVECPVCGAIRVVWNACLPVEFECGTYIFQSTQGWHLQQGFVQCNPQYKTK